MNPPRFNFRIVPLVVLTAIVLTPWGLQAASAQDAAAGEKVFKKCKACHAVGEDAKNRVGPQLNNITGRVAGGIESFKYSKALKAAGASGTVWNDETLDQYLTKPRAYIKGTRMTFAGLKKPEDRANLIAYLKTFDGGDTAKNEEAAADSAPKNAVAELPEPPTFTEAFLTDQANIDAGKEHWFAQCTHCHGFKAYPGKAPKLKPHKYKPSFVYKRVTKGFKKMPGWKEVFTQNERMQIVAYIKAKSFSP